MLALERLGESGPPAQGVPAPRRAWLKRALMHKRAPQAPSGAVREIARSAVNVLPAEEELLGAMPVVQLTECGSQKRLYFSPHCSQLSSALHRGCPALVAAANGQFGFLCSVHNGYSRCSHWLSSEMANQLLMPMIVVLISLG